MNVRCVAESVSVFAAGKYLLELSFEAPGRWDFGVAQILKIIGRIQVLGEDGL